jgi:outer membrane protein assembly factor BamD (BamD/ComL family)
MCHARNVMTFLEPHGGKMNRICQLLAGAFLVATPLHGAYLVKNGSFINTKYLATLTVEEHFQHGLEDLKRKDWNEAIHQFRIVITSFEDSSLAKESLYFLGVALYEQDELDVANKQFSAYLAKDNSTTHLEDVYRYKLSIAEKLASGQRRHLFGAESLPKLMTGRGIALEVYDEIASALPNHELAALALLGKAKLLQQRDEFALAIETYETAVRRFPSSSFALQGYQGISSCYFEQIRREPQNVDALALAEINVKEIRREFPQAKEALKIESQFAKMQEMYAKALYETGQLYERMSQPKAAVLYYSLAATKFPSSSVAKQSHERLKELSSYAEELHIAHLP